MNRREILKRIKNEVTKLYPSAKIILYGSRARGDFKNYSDWDLLILIGEELTQNHEEQIRDIIYDLELETGEVLCSIIHNKKEWEKMKITPFYKNVTREGVIL